MQRFRAAANTRQIKVKLERSYMDKETPIITGKIFEQILKVRNTGEANMFDIRAVMRVAYDHDLYELVCFLDEKKNHKDYLNFILTGER